MTIKCGILNEMFGKPILYSFIRTNVLFAIGRTDALS